LGCLIHGIEVLPFLLGVIALVVVSVTATVFDTIIVVLTSVITASKVQALSVLRYARHKG
jgi:hypothetical protein